MTVHHERHLLVIEYNACVEEYLEARAAMATNEEEIRFTELEAATERAHVRCERAAHALRTHSQGEAQLPPTVRSNSSSSITLWIFEAASRNRTLSASGTTCSVE